MAADSSTQLRYQTWSFATSLAVHAFFVLGASVALFELPLGGSSSAIELGLPGSNSGSLFDEASFSLGDSAVPEMIQVAGGSSLGEIAETPTLTDSEDAPVDIEMPVIDFSSKTAAAKGKGSSTTAAKKEGHGQKGGKGTTAGLGMGMGKGIGNGRGTGFFGYRNDAKKTVFVVDCSGSMNMPHPSSGYSRFQRVQMELVQAVSGLKEEQEFFIVFFNENAFPQPTRGPIAASDENKKLALEWVAKSFAGGRGTDPRFALHTALNYEPDVIYLLTDGEFDVPIQFELINITQRISSLNTIAFGQRGGEIVLKKLADNNRGTYKFFE